MKKFIFLFVFLIPFVSYSQNTAYDSLINIAKELYSKKEYIRSGTMYHKAFKTLGDKGYEQDRYDAARSWARASVKDSVFKNLFRLADKTDFLEMHQLETERAFMLLHQEEQWKQLLKKVNPNNETYNDSLAKMLISVYDFDQRNRKRTDEVKSKYGIGSDEYKRLIRTINFTDSLNLIMVENILKKHGWLSKNQVTKKGSAALWLVIQHAELITQEKYFPMMKDAVSKNKASKKDLAYLEDSILMLQGKKQLYGTQYKLDNATKEMKLWDIEDPDNLNKRREALGLPPM